MELLIRGDVPTGDGDGYGYGYGYGYGDGYGNGYGNGNGYGYGYGDGYGNGYGNGDVSISRLVELGSVVVKKSHSLAVGNCREVTLEIARLIGKESISANELIAWMQANGRKEIPQALKAIEYAARHIGEQP